MWRAATVRVILRRPAGALVNAALTAAALLWAGPATPGRRPVPTDASLSGITVDGNDDIVTSTPQYRYDVSGYTTQVTVVVTTTHGDASADIDPTPRLPRRFGPKATRVLSPSTLLVAWSG